MASCQIRVNVTSNTGGGPYNNTSASISGLSHLTNSVTSSGLTVQAYPILTKAFSGTATINVGQANILTFTINNNVTNNLARSFLAFTDTLPGTGGITATTTTPQCGGTVSVAGGNVISFSGGSIAAGGTCTITATVTGVTAGSYINGPTNSSISGVSTTLSNVVTDQTLVVIALPSITVVKYLTTLSDPAHGTTNPYNIPGGVVTYTIDVTNSGIGATDVDSVIIIDPIPNNTALVVTSPAVTFNPIVANGLTFTYASDVTFSEFTTGLDFTYVPTADGNGTDVNVKRLRINPKGALTGAPSAPYPRFTVSFNVRIQ